MHTTVKAVEKLKLDEKLVPEKKSAATATTTTNNHYINKNFFLLAVLFKMV